MKWLLAIVALGGVGFAFYAFALPRLESQIFKTEVSFTEVLSVSPAEASVQLTSAGYVVPQRVSRVAPKVVGKVAQVFVAQGQKVEPGQVLLTLDRADFMGVLGTHCYGLPILLPYDFLERERAAGRLAVR